MFQPTRLVSDVSRAEKMVSETLVKSEAMTRVKIRVFNEAMTTRVQNNSAEAGSFLLASFLK